MGNKEIIIKETYSLAGTLSAEIKESWIKRTWLNSQWRRLWYVRHIRFRLLRIKARSQARRATWRKIRKGTPDAFYLFSQYKGNDQTPRDPAARRKIITQVKKYTKQFQICKSSKQQEEVFNKFLDYIKGDDGKELPII